VRRIAISGLAALAAVLGGVAVPAAAMARPAAAVRPGIAARPADADATSRGVPMVSCVLASDCLGIRGSSSQSDEGPATPTVVARWNGSAWKRLRVALPQGAKSVDLNDVSCRGAKSCLVVGDYYSSTSDGATSHPLALIYNGTSLKPTPTVPLPKGTPAVVLTGVSCATTRYCVAVGAANGGVATFSGGPLIIETWNGAKWTLHTAAGSIGDIAVLDVSGVSCATPAFCVVTGESASGPSSGFTAKPYFASWNGKRLATMKPAAAGSASSLVEPLSVSCATPSSCAVTGIDVGDLSSSTPSVSSFSEIWSGKTWQLAPVKWPAGLAASGLEGVSCYAAHSCEAVGVDGANSAETSPFDAAAVSFHGAASTLQAVPAPSKGDSNVFTDVSCLPWGTCVAVGETGKTSATLPALMTGVWNGKGWKLDPGF
jgi:hypothetical protein